jgi:hypothetical protein
MVTLKDNKIIKEKLPLRLQCYCARLFSRRDADFLESNRQLLSQMGGEIKAKGKKRK